MKTSTFADVTTADKGFRSYTSTQAVHNAVLTKDQRTDNSTSSTYNQKEYAVASLMTQTLKKSLSTGMSEICKANASGKLTAQFKKLAKFEDGKTGMRPINLSKHGYHLNGFEFNADAPYTTTFGAKYHVKQGSRRGQVVIHFPSFVPEQVFNRPEEATNFKINARLVALSDHTYDPEDGEYQPICEEMHGKYGSFESPMQPILKMPTSPMTAMISIPTPMDLSCDLGLFLVTAVSFFRYENGRFVHLVKDSCMHIQEVF